MSTNKTPNFIEIHYLKEYPPTNLNRDDNNAPKTALYGGVSRGRISSQCLKRQWRISDYFKDAVGADNLGIRTRDLPAVVGQRMLDAGFPEQIVEAIKPKITGIANKTGKENKDADKTKQVVFYSRQDIDAITEAVISCVNGLDEKDVKKLNAKDIEAAIKGAKTRPITPDIAAFGRMVTTNSIRNVDAAMQVAHAIATHKTIKESDYFTAVDDLLTGETMEGSGAGHINSTDFISSCFYHYCNIDLEQFKKNIEGADDVDQLTLSTLEGLLNAMARTNPSGKQNSFAGYVFPAAFMVVISANKTPLNLVSAYEEPVFNSKQVLRDSIQRLADEADITGKEFGDKAMARIWFCSSKYGIAPACATHVCKTFPELIDTVMDILK